MITSDDGSIPYRYGLTGSIWAIVTRVVSCAPSTGPNLTRVTEQPVMHDKETGPGGNQFFSSTGRIKNQTLLLYSVHPGNQWVPVSPACIGGHWGGRAGYRR